MPPTTKDEREKMNDLADSRTASVRRLINALGPLLALCDG